MDNSKKMAGKENSSKLKTDVKPPNMPDGIDKTEARAKRKEAKKQNKGKKDPSKTNEVKSETKLVVVQPIGNNSDNKIKVETSKVEEKNIQNTIKAAGESDISKAELRAQRKALQEAQRAAKAAAKTTDGGAPQVLPSNQKTDSETTKKHIDNKNNVTAIPVNDKSSNESMESKAELRAKRRAIQEAQRQAKAQSQEVQKTNNKTSTDKAKDLPKIKRISPRKESISVVTGGNFNKQVQLFNHLYFHHSISITKDPTTVTGLHSSIIRLGVRYMSHNVLGSNARCLALLSAIKDLVNDYKTPPQQEFCRSLESNIQISTNYLQKCRPMAVSMTNAVRNIKLHLTQMPTNLSDNDKKARLLEGIDTYINDEIGMADKAISMTVQAKIYKGDVILTYGCSSIITKILLDAHESGKIFSVIVVDARPLLEGREMLRMLVNAGINCSYVLINAASFIMGRVTKVLLGAHSLLANGYVMSRAGTAQVALIAQAFNKPVLVCCETYKFCERVQTDSIVHNEIGDPDKLVSSTNQGKSPLANWKEIKNVTPLNLMYDITPPDLVTAVVTELAILPCTSVPVILRIKPNEIAL